MLIATSHPRKNDSPVIMHDGTRYVFRPNVAGVYTCEVQPEHAEFLLVLSIYSEVPGVEAPAPVQTAVGGKASGGKGRKAAKQAEPEPTPAPTPEDEFFGGPAE